MRFVNVHRRDIGAPAASVGQLIDTLATPADRLWPHEAWPAMRFDRPGLPPGARGGHGPVGYQIRHHEPGRSITFEFLGRPRGLRGHHQFVIQATGETSCVLWHLSDIDASRPMTFTWAPFWGPLHDALIEDSLDKALAVMAGQPWGPRRWPRYVRTLRKLAGPLVRRHQPGNPTTSPPRLRALPSACSPSGRDVS